MSLKRATVLLILLGGVAVSSETPNRERVWQEQVISMAAKGYAKSCELARNGSTPISELRGVFWDFISKYRAAIKSAKQVEVEKEEGLLKVSKDGGKLSVERYEYEIKHLDAQINMYRVVRDVLRAELPKSEFAVELRKWITDLASVAPGEECGLLFLLMPPPLSSPDR
jgi:hypothetical protein